MVGSLTKPPREWVEADIESLITNGVKESVGLDYKRSPALDRSDNKKREEISKDVSAFANAAGGVIVYGVEEDKQVPTRIDGGVDPNVISKEWLENVILSTVSPRLDGVIVNQVDLAESCPGRVAYVIEIPQATTRAPHQAADKKYYKRFSFKSEPMEDYEIRDVMRRSVGPDLYSHVRVQGPPDGTQFDLDITVVNESDEPALYAHVDVYVDDRLEQTIYGVIDQADDPVGCTVGGEWMLMKHLWVTWVTPAFPPIWKGYDQKLTHDPLHYRAPTPATTTAFTIAVVMRAPHMAPRHEVFTVEPTRAFRLTLHENTSFVCHED